MFDPHIQIGEAFTELQIHKIFECQTQFGIRFSKKNHLIVLIHKLYDNEYPDMWENDVLYYTGTDASSDKNGQTLSGPGNNNGRLFSAWDSEIKPTLFLFEKYAPNVCVYRGIVIVCQKPQFEPKQAGSSYMVWRFPLKLVPIDETQWDADYHAVERKEMKRELKELEEEIVTALMNSAFKNERVSRTLTTVRFDKKALYSAYVRKRAGGYCDLCRNKAPFYDEDGNPYLETHHIERLSNGGIDSPDNMVALCPNCHRKVHMLDLQEDKEELKTKAKLYHKFE